MSKQAQALTSVLLVVTCTTILVQSGLAQLPPALIPPGSPKDVLQCFSALTNIEGCVESIYTSISSGQISNVGPACCKAFLTIDANCLSKMFPTEPFFAPFLKNICTALEPTLPAPTIPGPTVPGPTIPEPIAPGPTAPGPTTPEILF